MGVQLWGVRVLTANVAEGGLFTLTTCGLLGRIVMFVLLLSQGERVGWVIWIVCKLNGIRCVQIREELVHGHAGGLFHRRDFHL